MKPIIDIAARHILKVVDVRRLIDAQVVGCYLPLNKGGGDTIATIPSAAGENTEEQRDSK